MLPKDFLSILACPICKGVLENNDEQSLLICQACGLRFPIRDGIPLLLAEEAERIS